jgi:DNA-binding transcriptional LysR family regulator
MASALATTTIGRSLRLSVDDFALFVRVAELRNLSAVARERDVPPSQLSRALARIEASCGLKLVHRSTHGLALTDEGQTLLQHATQVLQTVAHLEADFDARRGQARGLVRIATSPVMAMLLTPALLALRQQHPALRVDVLAEDRVVDIAREGIDIAVRTGDPGGDGLVARTIGHFSRVVCAAPAYLQRQGLPRNPRELLAHSLVANLTSPALNRWPFVVDGQGFEVAAQGPLRSDNTAVVLAMGLAGLGLVRLNASAAQPHLASGALVQVLAEYTPKQRYAILAVMLPDRQRLPKVRVCLQAMAAVLADQI